ncbi:MAG TPA: leucine-rich repeat domain-containing protein, partial [Salinivirgaceae bacterium]|nr:leucine-rich repeat domain-containing protein [Salinivirgaceae bacterium]
EILTNGNFTGVTFQIDDNVIETISRPNAFAYMIDLTAVTMSNLKAITGSNAFNPCSNLTMVSLPAAQTIGIAAFGYCPNLTMVSLPVAQTIGNSAFAYCSNLTTVSLPAAQTIGSSAFYDCSNLTTITFGKLTSFSSSGTFVNCYKLANIIIGNDTDINLDFSSLSNATWDNNIDASVWNENFVSGIINKLFDFTSGDTHTIKLGTYPYGKLTSGTKALATAKNWNITL